MTASSQPLSRPDLLGRLATLIDGVRLGYPTRVAFDGPTRQARRSLPTSSRRSCASAAAT
jgi:hypothetical protein